MVAPHDVVHTNEVFATKVSAQRIAELDSPQFLRQLAKMGRKTNEPDFTMGFEAGVFTILQRLIHDPETVEGILKLIRVAKESKGSES